MKKEKPLDKMETVDVCDVVGEIAIHYGFNVIKPPQVSNDDISKSKPFRDFDHFEDVHEKVALTKWYMDQKLDSEPQPVSFSYKKSHLNPDIKKKYSKEVYGFEIMGSSKSTSESLLIKCVISILEELGYENICVDINSIGDRESFGKYEREMSAHFRKNSHLLNAKSKQEFKKNLYSILKNNGEDAKEFLKSAPQTVGSLSENARLHFKEVLESLEAFGVAYKINPNIVSNKLFSNFTIFEIKEVDPKDPEKEGDVLAFGYRYNSLAKKLGGKREIPSMGATILVKKSKELSKKVIVKNIKKPKFYLVQLGNTAKLKALNVVELLRKHKIPIYHSITKDKITGQLSGAEYMKATHVLIIGQKEAVENSIVVRNIQNRSQDTVKIEELPKYLKALKGTKS